MEEEEEAEDVLWTELESVVQQVVAEPPGDPATPLPPGPLIQL